MGLLTNQAMDLIERAAEATSPAEVGRNLFAALGSYGVRALWARCQRSADPGDLVTYSRISPAGWEDFYAQRRFQEDNFLMREIQRRVTPFRWSDVRLTRPVDQELMGSLGGFRIEDGIGAPVHGPGGYMGVTSLAFERLGAVAPAERRAIGVAGLVLHLRMRELTPAKEICGPRLSPRERDCLAFVAEGLSDWEIGEQLGVAETTVITHLQNARRKLGARTRAQAVAHALLRGML